jgi:hypothetical protein
MAMKRQRRLTTVVLAAVVAVGALAGSGYAPHPHVIFRAAGKQKSWESRLFRWPGGRMIFRADMNCTALGGPPVRSFQARLIAKNGRVYANFNTSGNGSMGTLRGQGQQIPAGEYRLRVTTSCTWSPWRVTISTQRP